MDCKRDDIPSGEHLYLSSAVKITHVSWNKTGEWSNLCEQSYLIDLRYYGIQHFTFKWAKHNCLHDREKRTPHLTIQTMHIHTHTWREPFLLNFAPYLQLLHSPCTWRDRERILCQAAKLPDPRCQWWSLQSRIHTYTNENVSNNCSGKCEKISQKSVCVCPALTFPYKCPPLLWIASSSRSQGGWVRSIEDAAVSHVLRESSGACDVTYVRIVSKSLARIAYMKEHDIQQTPNPVL